MRLLTVIITMSRQRRHQRQRSPKDIPCILCTDSSVLNIVLNDCQVLLCDAASALPVRSIYEAGLQNQFGTIYHVWVKAICGNVSCLIRIINHRNVSYVSWYSDVINPHLRLLLLNDLWLKSSWSKINARAEMTWLRRYLILNDAEVIALWVLT